MLTHTTMPSTFDGSYLVVYQTPGCNVPTVACVCRTPAQAIIEADRLNVEQADREQAIQLERDLCGLNRIQPDLGGIV